MNTNNINLLTMNITIYNNIAEEGQDQSDDEE